MSAFEISVTPSRLKQKKRVEGREPAVVVMAPFSAKAIVQFEDVPITKTAKRTVRVLNPSDEDIEVKVTRPIKVEHNLSLEWTEHIVPARDEVSMELVWSPQLEVACKETLQLLDSRNFRKDVMIILKSKGNQVARNSRKFPTVGKTLQLKSPTGGLKIHKSTVSAAAVQQKKRLSAAASTSAKSTTGASEKPPWRNVPVRKATATQAPLTEHNVYSQDCFSAPLQSFVSPPTPGHKENVSPGTPANVLSMIDKFKFTPLNDTRNAQNMPDNLANWPTPILNVEVTSTYLTRDIKPRRLTTAELATNDDEPLNLTTTHFVTNKTFEINQEGMETSLDVQDYARTDLVLQTPTLNRTTTISHGTCTRPLECIREEDGNSPPRINIRTAPEQNRMNDLKRDIQMVGSPLRKYSESMKDLSLLSAQAKIAIQGSMPNLNEMAQIRSIEQNRYYQQQQQQEEQQKLPLQTKKLPTSLDNSSCSETSIVSHQDLQFNQHEILAQSSRFNLHEVGRKSRKGSPQKDEKTLNISSISHAKKRRSHELSFSDAPSTESLNRKMTATDALEISPPKRQRVGGLDVSHLRKAPTNASAPRIKAWTRTQPKKIKLAQTLSLMKKPATPRKTCEQPTVKLYDSELYMQSYINPDPFAATTTQDPFLACTMYLDEQAVERHQVDFKKWLNALVSIPADLDADTNNKIDVGKLFNEVRNKELVMAPTKDEQSMNYLTKYRLESLRRAAVELFFSEEMRLPCSKVAVYVNKQALRIRSDRNLHLDVVMQRTILELLLCFNPLWLRLGLEVVFGEKIHLNSNRDIVGLSTFILNRLFRNKYEEQKYSKAYMLTDEYAETIKRHTLQKMLFLLLFLDRAKQQRIVKHNPCLFVKQSPHKETKDILLRFSSELLANIGDITRELRRLGYVLQHKQCFLDEFNYAFNNLAIDLRDGVRLTRVMEIILLRDDLTKQLRVPAISRLQRIFNVKLALGALGAADFQLGGDISAADIVDGHREKTLSLLWQIIYKFRSPKFHAAARTLQQWWRRRWLHVVISRRIRHKEQQRKERAATRIQALFRGHQMRKYVKLYRKERVEAAIVLQKYMRRYLAQKQLYLGYRSLVLIQHWWRAQREGHAQRQQFLRMRASVIFLQQIWRRRIFARKLLATAATVRLQRDQKHLAAAACIQMHWRAFQFGRAQRQKYLREREVIINVQQRWRSKRLMRLQQFRYREIREAALTLQRSYRARCLMQSQRADFLLLRSVSIKIQRRWRGLRQMRVEHTHFLRVRSCVVHLQRRVRARNLMKQKRAQFQRERTAAIVLQNRYRARLAMRRERNNYQTQVQSLIQLQRRWRATLCMRQQHQWYLKLRSAATTLQRKYRANCRMRTDRAKYLELRSAALVIQRRFRALRLGRQLRAEFLRLRKATLTIQERFRAYKAMRFLHAKYRGTRAAVTCLQMHWRNYLRMKRERSQYLRLRSSAIVLQRAYRGRQQMKQQQSSYQHIRACISQLQRRWRATLYMRKQQMQYMEERQLIISIQRRWRAKLKAREVRRTYGRTIASIVQVQQRFRATLQMRCCRSQYVQQRELIISVQRRYRALLTMRSERTAYEEKREAAIRIQRWYRGLLETLRLKKSYQRMRSSVLLLQRKFRATLEARRKRQTYLHTLSRVRLLQRRLRATLAMRKQQLQFQGQRRAIIIIQQRFRAYQQMLIVRSQYQLLIKNVVGLQRRYRARRLMRQTRSDFLLLRRTTIHLQQKYRGHRIMLEQRDHFQLLRRSTLQFQAHVRGYLARARFQALMTPEMVDCLRRKRAVKIIQRYWRGYRTRKRHRHLGLQAIRQRVLQLRAEATTMNSVRSRVQEAVHFLRGRFVASEALAVLSRLDRLSRTVPHLLMWCSEFMSTFCYGIMAQAIRSEVDKQVIERCSRIILNLARYNSTTVNTFQEAGLVTIAQMLLRWCDKDSEIFNTLCTLIWVFAHCPKKRKIIHDFMTTTDAIYMVRETKKLVLRKEKMKQNARKQPVVVNSRYGQQQQQPVFSSRALPSLEPDFGIIRYRPYTFISSVYAFDTILCKLGIDIF
ncbi:protein abnormal spindle [Scaptodrosophila lebanonensis]|uniref:Protein abnormal spindle n=1 Tax=Drosophila lebanonensis TaxID=7225 RepID=A0A6J2TLA2_DROLE|nr:protein abnormal spindle [Scaptodrosophila lebanonensis]